MRLVVSRESHRIDGQKRAIALRNAYDVINLNEVLETQIRAWIRQIALHEDKTESIWYYRGSIMAYQQLLLSMKASKEQFKRKQAQLSAEPRENYAVRRIEEFIRGVGKRSGSSIQEKEKEEV